MEKLLLLDLFAQFEQLFDVNLGNQIQSTIFF